MPKGTVLILDTNHIARRAFHAMNHLRTSDGRQSGVVYIASRIFRKLLNQFQPTKVFAIFDGGNEHQKKKLSTYKHSRKAGPDHFYEQLNDLQDLLRSIGASTIRVKGLEADMIIGIVAWKLQELEDIDKVIIVSSDSDLLQLIDKKIFVYDDRKSILWTQERFSKEFNNSRPADIVLMKSIAGDSSDDIKGVPGVGETTAWQAVHLMRDRVFPIGMFRLKALGGPEYSKKYRQACSGNARLLKVLYGLDIVLRNRELIQIPHNEGFLPADQSTELNAQYSRSSCVHEKKVKQILQKYECDQLKDSLLRCVPKCSEKEV